MGFWEHKFDEYQIYQWERWAEDYFFVFAMLFFAFEILRLIIKGEMTWRTIGDAVANFTTLGAHLIIIALTAGVYLTVFYTIYPNNILIQLPNNLWTVGLCIILADIAYYWEHRAAHRLGIGWATHTVHHSSPHFNISVAYRHGPFDAFFGLPFHVPLVFIGFDPILVLFSSAAVQLYQTALHTETIGKLPRFIEAVMNTPSHHRVHHGSNPQYIDKNYAGIFIIWDKMFGTFAREEEKVIYGVLPPIKSVNPVKVFGHGLYGLGKKMIKAKGIKNTLLYLIKPPGWHPEK